MSVVVFRYKTIGFSLKYYSVIILFSIHWNFTHFKKQKISTFPIWIVFQCKKYFLFLQKISVGFGVDIFNSLFIYVLLECEFSKGCSDKGDYTYNYYFLKLC